MSSPSVIAVDGPAGSGKSTVSYRLAQRLGYLFIDTGVFYRAMTLLALRSEVLLSDEDALGQLTHDAEIDIRPEPDDESRQYSVWIEGEDVSAMLRSESVEKYVSTVAAVPAVRRELMHVQRRAAAKGKIIMAGRDIGTVVLPNADIKFYIDASIEERARRRYNQKVTSGESVDMAAIEANLRQRDEIDTHRAISPLRQADDAIYILTDSMGIEAVVDQMMGHIHA